MVLIKDGCYWYFFWEAEFNDKCKNQGYNENHICNISNFSKIHYQAERKISDLISDLISDFFRSAWWWIFEKFEILQIWFSL